MQTYVGGSHKTQYLLGEAKKIIFVHKFQNSILLSNDLSSPHPRLSSSGMASLCHHPAPSVSLRHRVYQHPSSTLILPPASPGIQQHLQPSHQPWRRGFNKIKTVLTGGFLLGRSDSRAHALKYYSNLLLSRRLGLAQHNPSSVQLESSQSQ